MTTLALITGANKGIGLETARQFGARGFTVLAGARDRDRGLEAERALRADGADARFVRLDVTDDASVRQAAGWIDREYGRLDILVNNAGIARAPGGSDSGGGGHGPPRRPGGRLQRGARDGDGPDALERPA